MFPSNLRHTLLSFAGYGEKAAKARQRVVTSEGELGCPVRFPLVRIGLSSHFSSLAKERYAEAPICASCMLIGWPDPDKRKILTIDSKILAIIIQHHGHRDCQNVPRNR